MKPITLLFVFLNIIIFTTGCVGIVSGDLADINKNQKISLPDCDVQPKEYQLSVILGDDYSGRRFAAELSTATLGIIPTYQFTNVHSVVKITHKDATVFKRDYKSKVHGFYGVISWLTLAPFFDNSNKRLSLGNSNHIGISPGLTWRTYTKALHELPKSIDIKNLCYQSNHKRKVTSLKPGSLFYRLRQMKQKSKIKSESVK